jgi:circadian clock protein KaiC
MRIDQSGIRVGEKLDGFRGVLTGTPIYDGRDKLLEKRGA